MTNQFKSIHVVVNPASGNNEPILNTLNDVFAKYDVQWDASITHDKDDAEKQTREALQKGVDVVAAYGGDGTLVEVVNGLVGSDTPLAILPGGTANAISLEFGIPWDLTKAVETIFEGEIRTVDLGKIKERHFLLRAELGITSDLVEGASREMKDRFGLMAYAVSAIKTLSALEKTTYKLTIDGVDVESEGIACIIANCNSVGTANLTFEKTVNPADGLLDVFIADNVANSLRGAIAQTFNLEGGSAAYLQHWQGKEITVSATPPQQLRADDELFDAEPTTITVVPQAMKVLARKAEN